MGNWISTTQELPPPHEVYKYFSQTVYILKGKMKWRATYSYHFKKFYTIMGIEIYPTPKQWTPMEKPFNYKPLINENK